MADDRRKNAPTGSSPRASEATPRPSAVSQNPGRGFTAPTGIIARDPRAQVVVPVRYRYESIIDFVETQSVNVSKSGMFVNTSEMVPVGTVLDFEVLLADGFQLLKGKAEVVRVSNHAPQGMGLKFVHLDEPSGRLINRIVEVNILEGKRPTVPLDFDPAETAITGNSRSFQAAAPGSGSAGVSWKGQDLAIQLNPATVSYFVYNPLLNIRLGGFVVPADREVPLGTLFSVSIATVAGEVLFAGKGKVVAKHEKRLGIRLVDVDKAVLGRLQSEVSRLVPSTK